MLGHSRQGLTNTIGFLLFVATFLGVVAHALARCVLRAAAGAAGAATPAGGQDYLFGRYERIWHWTMALSGVLLIVSGLEIHNAGGHWLLDLPRAVSLHNAFAVVLMLNAFLALFYHLATAAIRNFIPAPHGLLARVLEHMSYQSRGIFFGGPHPANAPGAQAQPAAAAHLPGAAQRALPAPDRAPACSSGPPATGPTWPPRWAGSSVVAPLHNLGSLALPLLLRAARLPGHHRADPDPPPRSR